MPNYAIVTGASADPLGLALGAINLAGVSGGARKEWSEVMDPTGVPILNVINALKPKEEWQVEYELLDGASFSIGLGAAVNTDYLVTALSLRQGADTRPTVGVTAIKPSSAAKIKAYINPITLGPWSGGFGVINKVSSISAASDFISLNASISIQTAEALKEAAVVGVTDYLDAGLYTYGFKLEITAEAYGAITEPANSKVTAEDVKESREGWKTYSKNCWLYLDSVSL
jgi:hypothetical protein